MNCIEITTKIGCIDCDYCPQDKLLNRYRGSRYLTLNNFKKYINKIPQFIKIHFSGFCEPFLNKNCIDMIEYVSKRNYNMIGLYTTTIGMNEDVIKRLKNINIEPFIIHLPEYTKNINYAMLKKILIKNIQLLEKYKIKYKTIIILPYMTQDRKAELFDDYKIKEKHIIYQQKISRAGNLFNSNFKFGKLDCDEERYHQNVLLPNGDIQLCCMDYSLKYRLGNLNKCNYYDLFKSRKYREIMNGLKDDSKDIICRHCNRAYKKKVEKII